MQPVHHRIQRAGGPTAELGAGQAAQLLIHLAVEGIDRRVAALPGVDQKLRQVTGHLTSFHRHWLQGSLQEFLAGKYVNTVNR